MNTNKLDKAIDKVFEEWESKEENRQTKSYIEFSDSDVKSCYQIIKEAICIFVNQNNI